MDYRAAFILGFLTFGIAATWIWLSTRRVEPRKERSDKEHETAWKQVDVSLAVIALIFLAFDMEMIFMFPWAVAFQEVGMTAFWELDESAKVFASAGEFRQVFSNLFINALDSISQRGSGRIRIRVRPSRDWRNSGRTGVRISIADNGSGISSQHKVKIFEPFFTTKENVGTGLGLWLSSSLVQKYDGRIQVRSRVTPGESGSVFSVFWPQTPKDGPPKMGY